MAGPTVVVSVLADTAKFKKDMDGVGEATGKIGSAFSGMAKIAGVALLATAVAVGGFLASSIKAAGESQVIAAQTTAVLESTQSAAGRTADQISNLAGELSILSGIDDEIIQKGSNVLLTFTNIQGVNFDAATKSALDMSVALGQDLQSASTLVGKALNDPIKGMSALSRVGVQLSEDQKNTIQTMMDLGDIAGAQGVILEELNRQFGGSAEAFGNTFEGAMGKVKTSYGNIQEEIGAAFLPIITQGLLVVSGALNDLAASPAFAAVLTGITSFIEGMTSGGGAASTFGSVLQVLSAVFNPFGLVIQALIPVLPTLVDSFVLLGSTLGGALVALLPTLTGLLNVVVSVLSGALAAVLPVVIGLITQLAGIFSALIPSLTPIIVLIGDVLTAAMVQLGPIIATLAEALGGILSAVLSALAPLLELAAELVLMVLEAVSPLIPVVLELVGAVAGLLLAFAPLLAEILPVLVELLTVILEPIIGLVMAILDLLVPALSFLIGILSAVVGFVADVITAFVGLITGSSDAQAQVTAIWQGVLDFFGGIPTAIAQFFVNAATWLVDAGGNIVDGLLQGLQDAIGAVLDWVADMAGNIADTFAEALDINSPSRVFAQFGRYTVDGLALGLRDLAPVERAMAGLSGAVADGYDPPAPQPYASASRGVSGAPELHIHLDGRVYLTQAQVGQAIQEALDEWYRLNGGPR